MPISLFLFILALETLTNKLRSNQDVRGIKCGEKEYLLTMHKDDMLLSLINLTTFKGITF